MNGSLERMREVWERLLEADALTAEAAAARTGLDVATVERLRASRAYEEARVTVDGASQAAVG